MNNHLFAHHSLTPPSLQTRLVFPQSLFRRPLDPHKYSRSTEIRPELSRSEHLVVGLCTDVKAGSGWNPSCNRNRVLTLDMSYAGRGVEASSLHREEGRTWEGEDVISLDRQRYMERDIRGIRRRLNKIVADHGPTLVAFDVWTGWWRAKRTVNEIAGGDECV